MDNNIIDKRTKGEWKVVESVMGEPAIVSMSDNKNTHICNLPVLSVYSAVGDELHANAEFICLAGNEYDKLKQENFILRQYDVNNTASAKGYQHKIKELENEYESLVEQNKMLLEALNEHCNLLSLMLGSKSLEIIKRFVLLENAKKLKKQTV